LKWLTCSDLFNIEQKPPPPRRRPVRKPSFMQGLFGLFISIWLKFFLLLTPFFVLSMFLALTRTQHQIQRQRTAIQVTAAVLVAAGLLYFFGNWIFTVFGITIDAFRVGGGVLLFLSAVSLVRGDMPAGKALADNDDITVVPLAIPVTIGPATAGALLVMGAEPLQWHEHAVGCAALLMAILTVGGMLLAAASIQRLLGYRGLAILSKLTGLGLAAMAAQMILTGVANTFKG